MNEHSGKSPLPGTLRERLRQGYFVMTAELVPPLSCDAEELLSKADMLKGLADAVNVTDGAGARAHMSALAGASLLLQAGIEPILQMTCRDKNRLALQSEMMGAAALGIRNLLASVGRRSQNRRSAGYQAGVRRRFADADRNRASAARRRHAADRPQGRRQG